MHAWMHVGMQESGGPRSLRNTGTQEGAKPDANRRGSMSWAIPEKAFRPVWLSFPWLHLQVSK